MTDLTTSKFKVGDRVRFTDKPFLSDGYINKIVNNTPPTDLIIVKLDEKAPSTYAWDTDEVFVFADEIELVKDVA